VRAGAIAAVSIANAAAADATTDAWRKEVGRESAYRRMRAGT